jgi:hypothetical protein
VPEQGFKTMPLRWSKYDKYRAEQESNVSADTPSDAEESQDSEDNA